MKSAMAITAMFLTVNVACAQQGQKPVDGNEKKTPPKFEELLSQMDSNKDGMLARAEVKGPLSNNFDKIDADHNGLITAAEMKAASKPQGPPPPAKN